MLFFLSPLPRGFGKVLIVYHSSDFSLKYLLGLEVRGMLCACAPAGPALPTHCLIILAFILMLPVTLGTFRQALSTTPTSTPCLPFMSRLKNGSSIRLIKGSLKTWRIENAIAPPHVESVIGSHWGAFK